MVLILLNNLKKLPEVIELLEMIKQQVEIDTKVNIISKGLKLLTF